MLLQRVKRSSFLLKRNKLEHRRSQKDDHMKDIKLKLVGTDSSVVVARGKAVGRPNIW